MSWILDYDKQCQKTFRCNRQEDTFFETAQGQRTETWCLDSENDDEEIADLPGWSHSTVMLPGNENQSRLNRNWKSVLGCFLTLATGNLPLASVIALIGGIRHPTTRLVIQQFYQVSLENIGNSKTCATRGRNVKFEIPVRISLGAILLAPWKQRVRQHWPSPYSPTLVVRFWTPVSVVTAFSNKTREAK